MHALSTAMHAAPALRRAKPEPLQECDDGSGLVRAKQEERGHNSGTKQEQEQQQQQQQHAKREAKREAKAEPYSEEDDPQGMHGPNLWHVQFNENHEVQMAQELRALLLSLPAEAWCDRRSGHTSGHPLLDALLTDELPVAFAEDVVAVFQPRSGATWHEPPPAAARVTSRCAPVAGLTRPALCAQSWQAHRGYPSELHDLVSRLPDSRPRWAFLCALAGLFAETQAVLDGLAGHMRDERKNKKLQCVTRFSSCAERQETCERLVRALDGMQLHMLSAPAEDVAAVARRRQLQQQQQQPLPHTEESLLQEQRVYTAERFNHFRACTLTAKDLFAEYLRGLYGAIDAVKDEARAHAEQLAEAHDAYPADVPWADGLFEMYMQAHLERLPVPRASGDTSGRPSLLQLFFQRGLHAVAAHEPAQAGVSLCEVMWSAALLLNSVVSPLCYFLSKKTQSRASAPAPPADGWRFLRGKILQGKPTLITVLEAQFLGFVERKTVGMPPALGTDVVAPRSGSNVFAVYPPLRVHHDRMPRNQMFPWYAERLGCARLLPIEVLNANSFSVEHRYAVNRYGTRDAVGLAPEHCTEARDAIDVKSMLASAVALVATMRGRLRTHGAVFVWQYDAHTVERLKLEYGMVKQAGRPPKSRSLTNCATLQRAVQTVEAFYRGRSSVVVVAGGDGDSEPKPKKAKARASSSSSRKGTCSAASLGSAVAPSPRGRQQPPLWERTDADSARKLVAEELCRSLRALGARESDHDEADAPRRHRRRHKRDSARRRLDKAQRDKTRRRRKTRRAAPPSDEAIKRAAAAAAAARVQIVGDDVPWCVVPTQDAGDAPPPADMGALLRSIELNEQRARQLYSALERVNMTLARDRQALAHATQLRPGVQCGASVF